MEWIQTIAGFGVGVLIGLTGVGGGALMTPLLILLLGVPALTAVGTDLAYAAITKTAAVGCHGKQKSIRWDMVKRLAWGSIPAALLSLLVLSLWQLNQNPAHSSVASNGMENGISIILGCCLLLTAVLILLRENLKRLSQSSIFSEAFGHIKAQNLLIFSGLVIGVLVTFSSVGAGALTAAVIFTLFPSVDSRTLVGTDLAHALPLTIIAGLGHLGLGHVDFQLLLSLLLGSLPGVFIGVRLGKQLPDPIVRNGLAGILLILGIKFIYSA